MPPEPQLNPYQPTVQQIDARYQQVALDFVPILRRWEKFRLIFNGVLILHTLMLSLIIDPQRLLNPVYWIQLSLGGLITNLCFFTGPAIEGYGRYFNLWNFGLSVALFVLGLLFTGFLATVFVIVVGL